MIRDGLAREQLRLALIYDLGPTVAKLDLGGSPCCGSFLALPSSGLYIQATQTGSPEYMPSRSYPQLDSFLEKHTQSRPAEPLIAVFDCDDTIIRGDIGEAMLYFQLEHFLFRVSPAELWPDFPKRQELQNLYEGLASLPAEKRWPDRRFLSFADLILSWYFDQLAANNPEKACADIVRLFADYTDSEVRKIAEATLRKELASPVTQRTIGRHSLPKGIRFVRETIDILQTLRKLDFDIWCVSGSNQWSVEAVWEKLGMPFNRVIGIGLEEKLDLLTSTVRTPIPVRQGKVDALLERSMDPPLVVVSDSLYDVPLFKYSKELKVLVLWDEETADGFFSTAGIRKDDSWLIIQQATLEQEPDA